MTTSPSLPVLHSAAFLYVDKQAEELASTTGIVIECGSRDINGTVRGLFPFAQYVGIDIAPGPGVDVVSDFRKVELFDGKLVEVVICCEVLEHDADPASLLAKAYDLLRPGGRLIMTCAGEGRVEHSAFDGGNLRDGEHYANVAEAELNGWLSVQGWSWWSIDIEGTDTRCIATR